MRGIGVFVFVTLSLFLIPSVLSESVSLDIVGVCREYNVTVNLEDFESACYDVKVDVTTAVGRIGRIYDPKEGWKSSFFYLDEGICVENGNASGVFRVMADTNSPVINFKGSVRADSKTWESDFFERVQDCPQVFPEESLVFWLAVLVPIAVILAGIVWHAKSTRKLAELF